MILFFWGNCASSENELGLKENSIWSPYQGEMKWTEAKEKCVDIGMRLPTIEELKAAVDAKITEAWEKDGANYWTSAKTNGEYAYYFSIDFRDVFLDKTKVKHTRCIR